MKGAGGELLTSRYVSMWGAVGEIEGGSEKLMKMRLTSRLDMYLRCGEERMD